MYRYLVWAFFASAPILAGSTLQTENLSNGTWKCRNGSYIPMEARCDGVLDCEDHSDESHALCWNQSCPSNRFRCTYGACVDITAPCNGVEDCADGSDEQLPVCRNQTLKVNGNFICSNGDLILAEDMCDGSQNCADGSDETLTSCAAQSCKLGYFQCAYGACVDPQSVCEESRNQDCADGSDETDELCNRITVPEPPKCVVPPPPEHASYLRVGQEVLPGEEFDSVTLTVDCSDGLVDVRCVDGVWLDPFPECKQSCRLPRHHSVTYFCGDRECNEFEPSGTEARPICKNPYKESHNMELANMNCVSDQWTYIATCQLKYWYDTEGNNLTLHIGENIAVHLSGSQYTVSLEDAYETISTKNMHINLDGPDEPLTDATVVVSGTISEPVSHDTVVETSEVTEVVRGTTPEPDSIFSDVSHLNPKYLRPRH